MAEATQDDGSDCPLSSDAVYYDKHGSRLS